VELLCAICAVVNLIVDAAILLLLVNWRAIDVARDAGEV
jgi:hypothetical protein